MRIWLALALILVFAAPSKASTRFLSPTGSDSNDGLTTGTPWLTPNHALNCGDVVIGAASTAYVWSNFSETWGTVTCAAGNNVAWLTCATFDGCRISVAVANTSDSGMLLTANYWGVQGWEVTTVAGAGSCFAIFPSASVTLHHIIFANDIANGCGQGGFAFASSGSASADYVALVGNIAYNAAQGSAFCFSGIDLFVPAAKDSQPGTHIYVAGNFSFGNVDPNPCAGGAPLDGEGIILDTFSNLSYAAQTAVVNNMFLGNGGRGVQVYNGGAARFYVEHNTIWGNNTDQSVILTACGEFLINTASNTEGAFNLSVTNSDKGCDFNTLYAFYVTSGDATDHVYSNYGFSATGSNTALANSPGFSFGPNNTFANPQFANATQPPAPSCGSATSVPNCMATVIANFTPTNAAAIGYGYQIPSTSIVYDQLYPQWLCTVTLPAGLVTQGCVTGTNLSSVTITGITVK